MAVPATRPVMSTTTCSAISDRLSADCGMPLARMMANCVARLLAAARKCRPNPTTTTASATRKPRPELVVDAHAAAGRSRAALSASVRSEELNSVESADTRSFTAAAALSGNLSHSSSGHGLVAPSWPSRSSSDSHGRHDEVLTLRVVRGELVERAHGDQLDVDGVHVQRKGLTEAEAESGHGRRGEQHRQRARRWAAGAAAPSADRLGTSIDGSPCRVCVVDRLQDGLGGVGRERLIPPAVHRREGFQTERRRRAAGSRRRRHRRHGCRSGSRAGRGHVQAG